MSKEFNITGTCLPDRHYMADVSVKMKDTMSMIEKGRYFIINRPRQYGKTTAIFTLTEILKRNKDYVVFRTSFEGIGNEDFLSEARFCNSFLRILAKSSAVITTDISEWLTAWSSKTESITLLGEIISELVTKLNKKVVIFIDEVDKSSNNQLFLAFLSMLRNLYLQRHETPTFHSVVLAGVHDVKSLKIKLRPNEESKLNSPWNIATDFKVDMNLYPKEIKPMLDDYVAERGVKMNTKKIAEHIFYYTSGYPFLVSKLCKTVDEDYLPKRKAQKWTSADIDQAALDLTKESNANFDSLVKNLEDNSELYDMIYGIAVDNQPFSFNIHNPLTNLATLYGIVTQVNGRMVIHNRIYNEVILNYMADQMHQKQFFERNDFGGGYVNPDNTLNMELVLTKYQAFMREQYSKKDRTFLERNGRLVFLAFMKPILNGKGFDFKETQISEERRLDVVLTYYNHKYVAELKIWRGEVAHEQGLLQLADYLHRQSLNEGYLVIFDHSTVKTWKTDRVEVNGKNIFMVWV
jgi:energy-coupling factor transporter ATP-binding protein EcfA2